MKVFAVGGAVRDALLGLPSTDTDWVVVGSSPEEMLRLGYRPVGKDFPVFLHPQTSEQYALARTERKTGRGYHGFAFDTSPTVTLEQDLERRDFTINAIARAPDGRLIDPWGGQADLERRVLRHVSEAFREDPLRVLRAARFAARFADLGFRLAPETDQLLRDIVRSGELSALNPDRVWQETERALAGPHPDVYFDLLRKLGALAALFPEIDALFGVPQPPQWHPEIDTGVHTLMALRCAAQLTSEAVVRFAVLTHDLGKAATPRELLPRHHGHEERSAALIEQLAERLPVPRRFRELADVVARHHGTAHRSLELRPTTLNKLFERTDAFRRPQRFEQFLTACEADARGRAGRADAPYPQASMLRTALRAALAVRVTDDMSKLPDREIAHRVREARIAAIGAARSAFSA